MTTKTVNLSIPHRLSVDEARRRVQNSLGALKSEHAAKLAQVQDTWAGNHMDFRVAVMGQSVTGRVDVREQSVDLALDLPWVLAMFADKIRGDVQREGTKLLEKK